MNARIGLSSALSIALATVLAPRTSLAGESERLAAEALFTEGRTLLASGNAALACEKFAASQTLDPSVGALFNLADCSVRRGETASAWLFFRDAAALAARNGDREREQAALARADALVVPKLTIRLLGATPGLNVRRDGTAVDSTLLGVATPVNPGVHVIDASAAGHRSWRTRVEVSASGGAFFVDIPALTPQESTPRPAPEAATPEVGHGQERVALALGGVGVLSLAVGVVFGLKASSTWSDVTTACPNRQCPNAQVANDYEGKRRDALRDAVISTGGFAVSLVALGTGAVLWWTARSRRTASQRATLEF
jgi:hypothetical protein